MITIYNEDCISGIPARLSEKSIDVIVTSPPYNLNIKYNSYKDNLSPIEYKNFLTNMRDIFYWVLSDNGSLFLNMGSKPTDPYKPFEAMEVFRNTFTLQNTIHWIKNITIDDPREQRSFGHFKPINSKRYINDCHEYIFHFTKSGDISIDRKAVGVKYQDESNINRWKTASDGLRCRGNNWFLPYETIQNKKSHPAAFPIELPKRCFLLHGVDKIGLALDPFLGMGNTAIAARDLGINFTGFEIDKFYYEESKTRIGVEDDERNTE